MSDQGERHTDVKELFFAAARQPEGDREEFLRQACGSDESLLREIASLLAYHEEPENPPGSSDTAPLPMARSSDGSPSSTGRLRTGQLFAGRYLIGGLVGRGGMGEVYRAHDQVLDVVVAIKLIAESRPELQERFLNEVRLARQVTHPSVCRVFDLGYTGREYFFTMEFIDGQNLASLLAHIGRFPPDRLLVVTRQLCAGLAAAHARGVLHQDLKPANVMIDGDGQARITDFGIATAARRAQGDRTLIGTLDYMAPERLAGEAASVRSDLYSLGLVLYEMATGEPAFPRLRDPTANVGRELPPEGAVPFFRTRPPREPSKRVPDLDQHLESVILRCLEEDPSQRPSSALEVVAALPGIDPLALALEVGETPSPELVAEAENGRSLPPKLTIGVAALLPLVLGGVFLMAGEPLVSGADSAVKPPEVLADRATQILEQLGHGERPVGRAWGFLPNLSDTSGRAPPFFWYRQSLDYLVPLDVGRMVFDAAWVDLDDPAPTDPGMVQMALDGNGRLLMLYRVPEILEEENLPPVDGTSEPDWSRALELAGFELQALQPAAPRKVPPVYADTRRSWTGPDPRQPADGVVALPARHGGAPGAPPINIEAAAYRGRVVYFSAWPKVDERLFEEGRLASFLDPLLVLDVGFVLLAAVAIPMALANLRRRRGDLRGARTLLLMVVALKVFYWLLSAHHVPIFDAELVSFHAFLGVVLVEGGLVWLAYIALEPTVRRHWPQSLMAWNRLLRGRLRDPLVGQSLVVGAVSGSLWALAEAMDLWIVGWLGLDSTLGPDNWDQLRIALSSRMAVANVLSSWIYAVYPGVLWLFLLAILRLVWRRPTWAALSLAVILGVIETLLGSHPAVSWLTLGVVIATSSAWILVRFGLLTYVVALFGYNVLTSSPVTADLSAWWSGTGLFALLVPAALGALGLWILGSGRPSLGGLFDPAPA